ncbi:MAG: CapA family protein [Clostridia bacterium]|nr:CapA family protein [Clostridia bacterium]
MKFSRIILCLFVVFLLAVALISCDKAEEPLTSKTNQKTVNTVTTSSEIEPNTTTVPSTVSDVITTEVTPTTEVTTTSEPVTEAPKQASIVAVGDNLIHMPLVTAAEKLGYDSLYEGIAPTIQAADLAIINQETVFVKDRKDWSGYPTFGTPYEIGEAALRAGFDVFTHATNHTFDKRIKGVNDTLEFWENHQEGIGIGIHSSAEEYDDIPVVEINGIKIAILNYSYAKIGCSGSNLYYSLNGIPLGSANEYAYSVSVFFEGISDSVPSSRKAEAEQIMADNQQYIMNQIAKAKAENDFVIVCVHWGSEYNFKPNSKETKWAKIFIEAEVDLVIGNHPHYLQPVVEYESESGHKTLIYYSLGNFISNQEDLNTNISGLATVVIEKDSEGTKIISYQLEGLTVDCQRIDGVNGYRVIKLEELTSEMIKSSWKWKSYSLSDFQKVYEKAISSYPSL